ncbi:fimbrillin family protein [Prevotella melaninogenica]|uniref:fimbrillin family protein n=1 Tax=Prevotella melaninogenica TaxID=28132 RepID=UPI001C5F245B|nr:fimbrillin family protein [Prevotella melaninogenica]MBW4735303.1 fimbrillin family protein [Prevotella melaninogenica]MBW4737788.1 fimbrillin family protein [Prevotella melaninogenica]MBW4880364.1 fimbrillin family protein [Prevotella melaninogenica]
MNKTFFYHALSALFVGGMAFSAVSCADDDLAEKTNNGDTEAAVRFDVSDSQEDAQTRGALTRGAITPGLTDKDLDGKKLAVESSENLDVCLIETTVEGVNPVKLEPGTRANITTLEKLTDFSSTGVRGTAANAINKEWFNEEKTRNNGILYNTISWSWIQPHGRFYAVYPESTNGSNGIKFTKPNGTAAPSLEFTVNTDVRKQVDLMTACSDNVHYATRFQAPRTNLQFRHALTAIRFAVGQNLSFNKTIKDITLKNVLIKSKYTLSNKLDGTGAAWNHSGYDTRENVTLSNVNYNTNENANSIIRDRSKYNNSNETNLTKLDDNYTFYMIPQDLDGKVTAEVLFTDGSKISVPLKGSWKAGTTRTYKLSEKNSSWTYTITATSPNAVAYNGTQANYKIESYREVNGTKQPVAWKVVGYSVDNGTSWTTTKPSWLKSLSKEQSNGGTVDEQGTATLGTDIVDLVAERNKTLQNAAPLGTATAPYNLSNATGAAAVQNTANSYLISAPGHYMIPLVYGNAIKNGQTNSSAYQKGSEANNTLKNFVDQEGYAITDPWIEKTNNGANRGIDLAWTIWSDEKDLVKLASNNGLYRAADGNLYIKFEVTKENIKSGNAVVSVRRSWQTQRQEQRQQGRKKVWVTVTETHQQTLWSWHLWFAPKNALDKITVTNKQGNKYDFTNEALGWKPTAWKGTSYSTPRTVKVKVEQTQGNNGVKQSAVITITQNPATTSRTGYTTLYQWGRKDAFPGTTATLAVNTINWNAGSEMYMQTILQNPQNYFTAGYKGNVLDAATGFAKYYTFYNLWSMNNTSAYAENQANSQTVVKTIYDPSPVGFSVPANDAFTGFTENGLNGGRMNVDGTDNAQTYNNNFGHNFWTNSSKTETIFFPAAGFREAGNGSTLSYYSKFGDYWTATPNDNHNGNVMGFDVNLVHPLYRNIRAFGFAVRPAAEK